MAEEKKRQPTMDRTEINKQLILAACRHFDFNHEGHPQGKQTEYIMSLIKQGANVNVLGMMKRDDSNIPYLFSPLHIAATKSVSSGTLITFLVKHGANYEGILTENFNTLKENSPDEIIELTEQDMQGYPSWQAESLKSCNSDKSPSFQCEFYYITRGIYEGILQIGDSISKENRKKAIEFLKSYYLIPTQYHSDSTFSMTPKEGTGLQWSQFIKYYCQEFIDNCNQKGVEEAIKILEREQNNHVLESSLLIYQAIYQAASPSYNLRLMSKKDTPLQDGVIYVDYDEKNKKIKYTVLAPPEEGGAQEEKSGEINLDDLMWQPNLSLPSEPKKCKPFDFENMLPFDTRGFEQLIKIKDRITHITSERGHTLSALPFDRNLPPMIETMAAIATKKVKAAIATEEAKKVKAVIATEEVKAAQNNARQELNPSFWNKHRQKMILSAAISIGTGVGIGATALASYMDTKDAETYLRALNAVLSAAFNTCFPDTDFPISAAVGMLLFGSLSCAIAVFIYKRSTAEVSGSPPDEKRRQSVNIV